jgi:4-amino-4-deoxychorismate lyase
MLQLIETVCWENGEFQRLALHEERMHRSMHHFFGLTGHPHLSDVLKIPVSIMDQKVKCRITYSDKLEKVEYDPYVLRTVRSLKLLQDDSVDYSFKLINRDALNRLFELRGDSDDILIVRNGLITDSSYANVVFLKEGVWFTPESPLLQGTKREYYLRNGQIRTMPIHPDDLTQFEEARLINAMLSIEDVDPILITNIRT